MSDLDDSNTRLLPFIELPMCNLEELRDSSIRRAVAYENYLFFGSNHYGTEDILRYNILSQKWDKLCNPPPTLLANHLCIDQKHRKLYAIHYLFGHLGDNESPSKLNLDILDLSTMEWTAKSIKDTTDFIEPHHAEYSAYLINSELWIFKKYALGKEKRKITQFRKVSDLNDASPDFQNISSMDQAFTKIMWSESMEKFVGFGDDGLVYLASHNKDDSLDWEKSELDIEIDRDAVYYNDPESLDAFQDLLFLFSQNGIECIDFKYGDKIYKCSKRMPSGLPLAEYPEITKTNDNFVHFLNFDQGKHIRVDLLDLIPDEIKRIHGEKLNLLVFGYIGRITKEFITLNTIPMDIVQLVLALCPVFLDGVSPNSPSNILSDIEDDLSRNTSNNIDTIKALNFNSSNILDRLSEILIQCVSKQTKVCTSYYKEVLQQVISTFGEESAMNGFILCWIDDNDDGDLYSFLHLITKYDALDLMKETIALFPNQYKVKINSLICK